jgi:peroxiredoxin
MKIKSSVFLILLFCSLNSFASKSDSVQVYIFLSETCPICQSVTLNLKAIISEFESKGVAFTAVYPNVNVSNKNSIEKFNRKYNLNIRSLLDENQNVTKKYAATITPEIVVVNSQSEKVIYRGKIDNGFEAIGKKRTVITEHYLKNALISKLNNQEIGIKETKPVGCYIIK